MTISDAALQVIRETLGSMHDPRTGQDVLSIGLVTDFALDAETLTVSLAPPEGDPYEHDALAAAIKRTLGALAGVGRVRVQWPKAGHVAAAAGCCQSEDPTSGSKGSCGCRDEQAPVSLPVLDPDQARRQQAGIAEDAGFGEGGPAAIPSPELDVPQDTWDGWPRCAQWEIDPTDSSLASGEARTRLADWDYEIWWQQHPDELLYVAIQALQDDPISGGPERKSPLGRNVVVNLVYDQRREAVIAVYGTARDFRPFIEAFRIGCGLAPQQQEIDA